MPSDRPDRPVALSAAPAPASAARWQVRLLGGLDAHDGRQHLTRFPSRAVAALLARLALAPQRAHAREELIELLWPGVALDVGRNRLRQALSTLKSLLEPAGQATAAVLLADRQQVQVVPGALQCDAVEFERACMAGEFARARDLYRGELMPGHYDDWVDEQRLRLAHLFERIETRTAALAPRPATASAAPATALPAMAERGGSAAAAPGPAAAPPPLLPQHLTRYFDAADALQRLAAQVRQSRLVTLVGPGGSGKSRLAVELAHAERRGGEPFDLVAWVPLLQCADAEAMPEQLLGALHLRADAPQAETLLQQSLAGRRVLLLLDNLEHLLPAGATPVARWLESLPGLHVLATSRRPLGLDGEALFELEAMPLPPPGATLDQAAHNAAVALFVDRARAARSDFHLGPRNAAVLGDLVRALGGLPLALELAAARVRSFSPQEMLQRLTAVAAPLAADGATPTLDLLSRSGPRGGRDARHASMQEVIAWSWALLTPAEAQALAASTVFGGAFTAAALAWVCEDPQARLRLDALQSHSLLRSQPGDDDLPRFVPLPPVREFAATHLEAGPARVLRARHRQWLLHWAASLGRTPPLDQVRAEIPNLATALAGALHDGEPGQGVQLLVALRRALADVALPPTVLDLLAAALEADRGDDERRSRGYTLLGLLGARGGRPSARADVDQGLALAALDSPARPRALHAAASLRWRLAADAEGALALLDEAERRPTLDDETRASVLALRGAIAGGWQRDPGRSEQLHRQAFEIWQRLGNTHAQTSGHYNLAICATRLRRWNEALRQLEAAAALARAQRDWQQLSLTLNVLGNTRSGLRDWTGAAAAYRDAAELAWSALEIRAMLYALWNAPLALAHLRQPEAAARLMGFAAAYWQVHFGLLSRSDESEVRRTRRLVAVQTGQARCQSLWAEGQGASLAQAVAWLRQD